MIKQEDKAQKIVNQEDTIEMKDPATDGTTGCGEQSGDNMSAGDAVQDDNKSEVSADSEWKDKYLRLSAEFDNYRKRTLREKMELIASGGEDVLKSLLPVVDDMDRAMQAMCQTEDIDSVRTGVELIAAKLCDLLRSQGVAEIEAVGAPLDTDLHEAVAKFPVEDDRKGLIIDVVQKGYKHKDKVLRYAKVVVGE